MRYELTDDALCAIRPMLPNKPRVRRPGGDSLRFRRLGADMACQVGPRYDGCLHQNSSESWRPVACACVRDECEIPSTRTPFLVGRSGSSKPRLQRSRSARLSIASSTDLLRVIC